MVCGALSGHYGKILRPFAMPWSNGQTEGQINKLKTLKRAMYGRASVDLLRARMMPLRRESLHRK
jgi:transposase